MQIQNSSKAILQRFLHRTRMSFLCATRWKRSADHHSRFSNLPRASLLLLSLLSIAASAFAQTDGLKNPQPAPEARNANNAPQVQEPQPSATDSPTQVAIPANQTIPVTLDTTLSTVGSKQGQIVTFRMRYSMPLGDGLEIPPETRILGHLVGVKRPAHFGREGELRLAVDRIQLAPDGGATLAAHLDSDEMKGPGRFTNDNPHPTDLHPVAIDSAGGALVGAVSGGASGAAVGAGTGAALAVFILRSPRGQDVYLEQGMHFAVILDQPVYLSAAAVRAAQEEFKRHPRPSSLEPDSQHDGQPQLRRRQAPPN